MRSSVIVLMGVLVVGSRASSHASAAAKDSIRTELWLAAANQSIACGTVSHESITIQGGFVHIKTKVEVPPDPIKPWSLDFRADLDQDPWGIGATSRLLYRLHGDLHFKQPIAPPDSIHAFLTIYAVPTEPIHPPDPIRGKCGGELKIDGTVDGSGTLTNVTLGNF